MGRVPPPPPPKGWGSSGRRLVPSIRPEDVLLWPLAAIIIVFLILSWIR